jgi:hypothetical protein
VSDITIGVGDRLPIITRTITVDGAAVDLTGGTASFRVYAPATMTTLISTSATISSPATAGIVTYTWSAGDAALLTAGNSFAQFVVTLGSRNLTAPNDGYMTVLVSGAGEGSFTYSGDPSARGLDAVRFLINDTDSADPLMTDAEINWLLDATEQSVYQAAHDACYALAGKFARQADTSKSVGDLSLSITYSSRGHDYTMLAERFLELANRREPPAPWTNSQTLLATRDRIIETRNTDFYLGQDDYNW